MRALLACWSHYQRVPCCCWCSSQKQCRSTDWVMLAEEKIRVGIRMGCGGYRGKLGRYGVGGRAGGHCIMNPHPRADVDLRRSMGFLAAYFKIRWVFQLISLSTGLAHKSPIGCSSQSSGRRACSVSAGLDCKCKSLPLIFIRAHSCPTFQC